MCVCSTCSAGFHCFRSGDSRTTENLGLAGIHTVFVREHNRVARELSRLHAAWSDERLYQETRRLLAALLQHIAYDQFLPALVGAQAARQLGLAPAPSGHYFRGHNPAVSAQLYNEFATAAMRYGRECELCAPPENIGFFF